MKGLFIFSLLLASGAIFAKSDKVLTCTFNNIHENASLSLAVSNLGDKDEMTLTEAFTDYEGEPVGVSFSGESEIEWLYFLMFGDSWFNVDDKGNIDYQLDSDGCDVGRLKIYKNNGYQYGYVAIKHRCSGSDTPDTFSKAKCKVTDL